MKKASGKAYLILEVETGLMDGWYRSEKLVRGMDEYWDEARPGYSHVTVALDASDLPYIPDQRFLANARAAAR